MRLSEEAFSELINHTMRVDRFPHTTIEGDKALITVTYEWHNDEEPWGYELRIPFHVWEDPSMRSFYIDDVFVDIMEHGEPQGVPVWEIHGDMEVEVMHGPIKEVIHDVCTSCVSQIQEIEDWLENGGKWMR